MDAPSPAIGGGATPSLSTGLPSFATTPQLVSTPNLSASTTSTAAGVQPTGGSLASKWDALGVGQDVFRCLVKYGCVNTPECSLSVIADARSVT